MVKVLLWLKILPILGLLSPLILLFFNPTLKTMILVVAIVFYVLFVGMFLFRNEIFRKVEKKIENESENFLELEKSHSANMTSMGWSVGSAFLIPGLLSFDTEYLFAIIGLAIIVVTSMVYYWEYFPRYILSKRKLKIKEFINSN